MSEEKIGIEETMELVVAVREVVQDVIGHMEDGKVDGFEVTRTLVGNAASIMRAMNGVGEVPAELKDLDESEKERLLGESMGLIMIIAQNFFNEDEAESVA